MDPHAKHVMIIGQKIEKKKQKKKNNKKKTTGQLITPSPIRPAMSRYGYFYEYVFSKRTLTLLHFMFYIIKN